ncbi:MAG TPA: glycogen phosphorylase [Erysipelotrichaceae bacterium]|nr:MAG: glycogen phosphorylase [Firmicutes bacterium GWE2_51_13]HAO61504.1 glycogen phosphorylase [Erysipelotrichaceae bacterium]HBZ41694.1 glycogen phosphorylase [Erysipelotrichaceae bacterium]
MFQNKFQFKRDFTQRVVETYGRSVEQSHRTERYMVLGGMVRDYASIHWKESKEIAATLGAKQMVYFSMEFLIGRLLTSNLMNLGIYDVVKDGLSDLGIDINEIENMESDAGLGNGGLGRLAACFLDSLASLSLPGHGNCLRYEYGLFRQKIQNGYQIEVPDQWLRLGNVWEVRKPKHAVEVKFWGRVEMRKDEEGKVRFEHVDAEHILAVPYDMPVVGKSTDMTNTLRLWSAEASDILPANKDFRQYITELREICQNVYPDDSTEHGRFLRLKQQYFFVSAGLAAFIKGHLRIHPDLTNLPEKVVFQLNDTHPVLSIPELMRILMDDHGFDWDQAWGIVSKVMAYTNHTVMAEALEKWPVHFVQQLLPRIYMIIEEINKRFLDDVRAKFPGDEALVHRVSIIKDGQIHMANLAIVGAFSVNGVAKLHTEILINDVMKDFYLLFPDKFNNKTNGITHRRWLLYSNPQLKALLDETIGEDYAYRPEELEKLMDHVDDKMLQAKFMNVKRQRKMILAAYIKKTLNIDVDVDSIFDVQAKRLHAYKRQLLNVLHIISLIKEIENNPEFTMTPRTFIFAAKAAPAYYFAKKVIKLIHSVAAKVNDDPKYNKFLKVVFIPNYNVSIAEILMNAADVSEQISTAGKEASGTGNMKFMMNGAITLGTLDGANVEIDECVGRDYDVIFGMTVEEIDELKKKGYDAWKYYNANPRLKSVVDSLIDGTFEPNREEFKAIFDELMYRNDEYYLLADFDAYAAAQLEVQRRYLDNDYWPKMCLVNIAKSGFFSSDRTIRQYADEIWHIRSLDQ